MKGKFTRLTLLLILVAMVATSLLVPMQAFGATTPTGYTSASDVVYNTNGNYIYNWGARGETATFLSRYALSFYAGSNDFDTVSALTGGNSESTAPNSALYKKLQDIMVSAHTYINGYGANNTLLQYTDCEKGGGTISSFYSGKAIGPAWDSAATWNKEHTWPNSKGLAGSDEDDVMMIRPTSVSENSSRGNKAYGESSNYYHPNNESNGAYDLRGDCARIVLYVYTRWGNTQYMWGTSGVMESMSVLLKWMQQDPVDTWEMGRNDAVQAITGTRNVFVDYPEYAFLLFGQSVPDNYPTPSNGVTPPDPDNCTHSFQEATCNEPAICTICWTTQGEALGHTEPDSNGLCTRCGEILQLNTTHAGTKADPYTATDALKVGSTLSAGGRTDKVYVQGEITNVGTVKSNTYRAGMVITDATTGQALTINTANPNTSDDLNVKVGDTILLEGYIRNNGGSVDMGSQDYSTYTYYSIVEGGQTHTHSYGEATCTMPATCSCGATQGTALGHTTQSGTCTRCGATIGGSQTDAQKSIDLTSATNKVSASANLLAFANGELKVNINKASATSDLVDKTGDGYAARVYYGATLTVEYPQMTKIVINCDDYTSGGKVYYEGFDGMTVAGATITRDGTVITIEFATPVDTFTSASVSSQVRIKTVEVYTSNSQTHTHSYSDATCTEPATCSCGETQGNPLGHTEVVDSAVAPTCTTDGKTQGKHCSVCNEILVAQTTVPSTGHTEPNDQGKCDTCNEQLVDLQLAINNFKSAVANVQSAVSLQSKFNAIQVAVSAYNSFNDIQKAQVTAEFATLKTQIESYNADVSAQNTNASNALAIAGIATLVAAVAVLTIFKKVF